MARLWLPIFLALKAEAHAKASSSDTALRTIDEALSISKETGESWALAEVLRIKARLLRDTEDFNANEVENLLAESLDAGRRQQAFLGSCVQLATLPISCKAKVAPVKR